MTAVGALFLSHLGYRMILWMRHFEAHALTPGKSLVRAGLTSGVVKEAVAAAKERCFERLGVLVWNNAAALGGAAALTVGQRF